jgi:perosamine synthetase
MITIVLDKKYNMTKEKLIREFAKYRIQARPFFYPLSSLPAINQKADTPVAFDISSRAVNLPCGLRITKKEVDYICQCLRRILKLKT